MLQTQFGSQHNFPFSFEYDSNWPSRTMSATKESHRRTTSSSYLSPPTPYGESPISHGTYEYTTPRVYSHPSSTASSPSEFSEIPPWLSDVPASHAESTHHHYAEVPAVYSAGSVDTQYTSGGESGIMYAQTSPLPPYGSHGSRRPDPYYPYDGPGSYEFERDSKRVRLSPFSEYDSSSSEYDSKDRGATPAYSDYARSPQISHSTRSSPAVTYSPSLATAPTSNPEYPHLVAFAPRRRKSRRKLQPGEREEVHKLRKMGACTRCWGLKMKCDDGNPCHRCEKLGAGAMCVRVHFVDLDVFSKWLVDAYSRTMMHHVLRWTSAAPRNITISHEKSLGVSLQLSVYEFTPAYPGQLQYWYKDASGWKSMQTTAYAMKRGINTDVLEKYIQDHTYYYIETAFPSHSVLSEIFRAAWKYSRLEENFLLRDALQLWTATQLLMKGAMFHPSSDALDIEPIPSATSPMANQIPLPRVLSNQLDHLFERRIWQLEKQILCDLQKRIFGRKKEDWVKIFFTLVVLMNSLERDTWRLYYWLYHSEDGYAWRHPSSPERLIEKNNILSTSLAAHFTAISKGLTPFALDWSREQTLGLIGNCDDPEGLLASMDRIGRGIRSPDHALHTENVANQYRENDQKSLDYLYTSKVMFV